MLTDSELLLFTDQVAVVSLVSFVSFMIMPAFLLRFIGYIQGEARIFDVFCRLYFAVAALYLANYLLRLVPSYLLVMPAHLLSICAVVLVIQKGLKGLREHKSRELGTLMAGFGVLSIFGVLALVVFYLDPVSQYSVFYCIGVAAFILCLMNAALGRLYRQVEENAKVTACRHLAYTDAMTGMRNRAAFMERQQRDEGLAGLCYILFDINDLKRVNDQYGHQEGDRGAAVSKGGREHVRGEAENEERGSGGVLPPVIRDGRQRERRRMFHSAALPLPYSHLCRVPEHAGRPGRNH